MIPKRALALMMYAPTTKHMHMCHLQTREQELGEPDALSEPILKGCVFLFCVDGVAPLSASYNTTAHDSQDASGNVTIALIIKLFKLSKGHCVKAMVNTIAHGSQDASGYVTIALILDTGYVTTGLCNAQRYQFQVKSQTIQFQQSLLLRVTYCHASTASLARK